MEALMEEYRLEGDVRKATRDHVVYEMARERAKAEVEAKRYAADIAALAACSRNLTSFLNEETAEASYDVADLLPAEGNFTLVAAKKTGKTSTTIELVRAYADGSPFLGRFEITGGPQHVGMWDYEMGDPQLREWLRRAGIRNTDRVHLLPLRGQHLSLRTPATREWAAGWLRDRRVGLWLLDPAHRAMTGFTTQGDPNTAAQEFTETLEQIKREAGVRNIGLPVHTGLSGEHARGASRWGEWPDAIWKLKKDENGRRTLSAEGRDVDLAETTVQRDAETRRLSVSAFDNAGSAYQGPSDVDRLCMWLDAHPDDHPSKRRVAEILNVSQEKAATILETAEDAGRIVVRPGPRRSQRAWLPEHVEAEAEAAQPRQMEL
ncbi:hypothetical protein STTU_0766 [Streptomyces sp. Tu6071]|nr:hypothetical protein STTU_0766 [Streptomyces sp. Tu6071]